MDILEVVGKVVELSQIEGEFSDEIRHLRSIMESLQKFLI